MSWFGYVVWIELCWLVLNCIWFCWVELVYIGFYSTSLCSIVLNCMVLGWFELYLVLVILVWIISECVELYYVVVSCTDWDCVVWAEMCWVELNGVGFCFELVSVGFYKVVFWCVELCCGGLSCNWVGLCQFVKFCDIGLSCVDWGCVVWIACVFHFIELRSGWLCWFDLCWILLSFELCCDGLSYIWFGLCQIVQSCIILAWVIVTGVMLSRLNCVGFYCIELYWTALVWTVLSTIMSCIGLGCVMLWDTVCYIVLGWTVLIWVVLAFFWGGLN